MTQKLRTQLEFPGERAEFADGGAPRGALVFSCT